MDESLMERERLGSSATSQSAATGSPASANVACCARRQRRSEFNVKLQLQQPWIKTGTDTAGPDPDRVRALLHRRSYGTYPRILGRYVRDEHVLTLEDAVRKMSSAVATRLSIPDRGVLGPGMYADVVIFDPNTIIDRATFEQPKQLSAGMRDVWVS